MRTKRNLINLLIGAVHRLKTIALWDTAQHRRAVPESVTCSLWGLPPSAGFRSTEPVDLYILLPMKRLVAVQPQSDHSGNVHARHVPHQVLANAIHYVGAPPCPLTRRQSCRRMTPKTPAARRKRPNCCMLSNPLVMDPAQHSFFLAQIQDAEVVAAQCNAACLQHTAHD